MEVEKVIVAELETAVMKLVYGDQVRLVEVVEPVTLEAVRAHFKQLFGVKKIDLTYSIPGDEDTITVANEQDLKLARRFGGVPLRLVAMPRDDETVLLNAFECAEAQMAKHGLEAPASQIELLLQVLELKPRRLVKAGLAPPKSLKNLCDKDDDDEPQQDKSEWETVAGAAVESEEDEVVEALRVRGVTMDATTVHVLLRLLDVPPMRFVKLKLLQDVHAARKAYKRGGTLAASVMFKDGPPHDGWGRGLCGRGGRGRGGRAHAWDYAPWPKRFRHHAHHGHHGNHHFHDHHCHGGPFMPPPPPPPPHAFK